MLALCATAALGTSPGQAEIPPAIQAEIDRLQAETTFLNQKKALLEQQLAQVNSEAALAIAELSQDVTVLQERAAVAKAQRDAFEAALPTTEEAKVTPPGGTANIGNTGLYGEFLAYQTLTPLSAKIAKRLNPTIARRPVVLVDRATDLSDQVAAWELLDLQLSSVIRELEEAKRTLGLGRSGQTPEEIITTRLGHTESVASGLAGVSQAMSAARRILGATANIVAYFKVDTKLEGRTFDLKTDALFAELSKALDTPRLILPGRQINHRGLLQQRTLKLLELRSQLLARKTEIAREANRLKKKEPDNKGRNTRIDTVVAGVASEIDAVAKAAGDLHGTLTKLQNVAAGTSAFQAIADIDAIRAMPDALILRLTLSAQGAQVESSESIWRSARLTYAGGTVGTYILTDGSDGVLASGVETAFLSDTFKASDGIGIEQARRLREPTGTGRPPAASGSTRPTRESGDNPFLSQ